MSQECPAPMDSGAVAVGGPPGQPGMSSSFSNLSLNAALFGLLGVGDGGVTGATGVTPQSAAGATGDPQAAGSAPAPSRSDTQLQALLGGL